MAAVAQARRPRLIGHEEPRVFTPPLRPLTPETSLGFAVAEFADEVLGVDLYPWQRWLLVHALELLEDGSFRFRTVVVLVARQNGKSTLSIVLSLFFLYVLGTALVIGTAQDLDVAEEIWQGAVDIVDETPELLAQRRRVVKVNGKKSLELKTGERYKVKAANRRAGRGLSGDLILLDELREHQSWDAWAAITKTAMARPNAQAWALSNAGDVASVVLRHLRKMVHAKLGDPDGICAADDPAVLLEDKSIGEAPEELDDIDDDTLGLFEWSAPVGCGIRDRDGWAMANPSLGHGTITERALASAAASDPEWVFRTECLCQWSEGSLTGPFPPGSWDSGTDVESSVAANSERVLCFETNVARDKVFVAVAGRRDDGAVHVEPAAVFADDDAAVEWLLASPDGSDVPRTRRYAAVTARGGKAPVATLLERLKKTAGVKVVDWPAQDVAKGCAGFFDLVRGKADEHGKNRPGVFHRPSQALDAAAQVALTRPSTDGGWTFDPVRSPLDISALYACVGAAWLLTQPGRRMPPPDIF